MDIPSLPLAIFGLGGTELIVVFLIILLLFGGAKLPGLAKGLGQSIREFKKASRDDGTDDDTSKPNGPAITAEAKRAEAAKHNHGSN